MKPRPLSSTGYAGPSGDGASTMVSHLRRTDIFRDYQQAFENTTGLPLALRPAGSFQSPLHDSKRLNPFCALMAQRDTSCAACLQLQQRVEEGAAREPKTLECFAGLSESAVPVRIGEKLVGYLQTGQVFLRPPTRKRFKDAMHGIRGPEAAAARRELETAYFKTRLVAKSQYESIIRLLAIFAEHLAVVSNQVLVREATTELPAMTKVRAFIAEHQSEDLHQRDAARAVNMSAFYFCRLFKKTTGFTFTDYLARRRIEAAKQMLLNMHLRVSEAAYAVGFQSLSQFNRAFQRVAGESPSDFRNRLHRPALAPGPFLGGTGEKRGGLPQTKPGFRLDLISA